MNRRWIAVPIVLLLPSFSMAGGLPSSTVDLGSSTYPRIDGPAAGGAFGSGALATGDVNGDGIPDIVIGAPDDEQGRGVVYCVFGQAGVLPQSRDLATASAELTIIGPAPGTRLGVAAVVADLDGDGAGELVVSTGGYSPSSGRLSSGGALIFRGGSSLGSRASIDLATEHADACVADSTVGVAIGASLAVGDFNHDSYDDLAVGSPASPGLAAQVHAGRVFVLPGGESFPDGEIVEVGSSDEIRTLAGSAAGDEAGTQLATGDVDNDRVDDLLIGMPNSTVIRAVTFEKAGRVMVVAGGDISRIGPPIELTPDARINILGSDFGDYFGFGLAVADVTGDGLRDVVASAIDGDGVMNQRFPDCGEVYTIASVTVPDSQRIVDLMEGDEWMRVIGDTPRRFLGGGLAAGDMDGNRRAEIVASSKSAPGPNGMQSGVVYVLEGAESTVDLALSQANTTIYGPSPGSGLGAEIRTADLNGDGVADIVATAPGALSGRGSVYVIPGVRTTDDRAPAIDPVADVVVGSGEVRQINFHATDADGDPVRFSVANRPAHASFHDGGDGDAQLTFELAPGADYQVRVSATDGQLTSSITFHATYTPLPLPVISKSVYKNGALKITGQNFAASASITVNERLVGLPVTFNAPKGRLRIRATAADLGLLEGQGMNSVVVTVNGRPSEPYQF